MERVIRVGVIGVDHGHILGMAASMRAAGAQIVAWSTGVDTGDAERAAFRSLFPDVPQREEAAVLEDGGLDIILSAAVNADRARIAIAAMRHGKDVMVDKPGCTSLEQLAQIRQVQAETGRIWSVCFSERLQVESATLAGQLIAEGRIGKVVQTVGLGPHRLNAATRPDWFWTRERSEGHHGGADPVMLGYIFDPEGMEPDRFGRASDHVAGGWSILTGIAANMSIETGSAVNIPTMLRARGITL